MECLKFAEQFLYLENRNGNLTQELKEVLDQRTNELLKLKMEAEGTTQDLQHRFEEISEREKIVAQELENSGRIMRSLGQKSDRQLPRHGKQGPLLRKASTAQRRRETSQGRKCRP